MASLLGGGIIETPRFDFSCNSPIYTYILFSIVSRT